MKNLNYGTEIIFFLLQYSHASSTLLIETLMEGLKTVKTGKNVFDLGLNQKQ